MGYEPWREVVLLQRVAQELGRIEELEILPEKLPPADHLAVPEGEELERHARALPVISEDVNVIYAAHHHLLLFGQVLDHLDPVPVESGRFVHLLLGRGCHLLGQAFDQQLVLAFEKQDDVPHCLLVLLGGAEAGHARTEATVDVVLQAGPLQFPIDLQVTGPKQKVPIDYLHDIPGQRGGEIRPEVEGAVVEHAARQENPRKRLLNRQLDMEKSFVVFEIDVKSRLVPLGQRALEDERFDLAVGRYVFQIPDVLLQDLGLRVGVSTGLKVGSDAILETLRFPDINDLAGLVLE